MLIIMSYEEQRKAPQLAAILYSADDLFMTLSPMAQYIHTVSTGTVWKVVPKTGPSPPRTVFKMIFSYILLL